MFGSSGFGLQKGFGFGGGGGHAIPGGGSSHGGGLNLTPMIDMLTILLVFLIKSYSVTPYYLAPSQGINLSQTTSENVASDQAVLLIGKDGIIIDGKVVVGFKDQNIDSVKFNEKDLNDLQTALTGLAKKTKLISESNKDVQFTGTLILQADRELPFAVMKPILRTAGVVGFNDIKFAALYPD